MTGPGFTIGRRLLTACAVLALGACAVGPDFLRPKAPETSGYAPEAPAATAATPIAGGEAQKFLQTMDIPGQWWALFHSQPLNELIEEALHNNADLAAAQAALRAANDNVYAQMGAYYPSVAAGFQPTRARTSQDVSPVPANGTSTYTLYTAQLSVSYMPDVFGLNRRLVESLRAQAEGQRFVLEATYLTLTSNIVAAAVQEASLRGQIAATQDIIKLETDLLGLLRRQYELGQVAGLDVAAQEAALAQAQQTLPPLLKQLALQRDLLTALIGRFPDKPPGQQFELASLQLPQDLPLSLPSQLVEQRPDVRQAEANLHAASAQIGVAIANRLPNIMLTADYGSQAVLFRNLLTGPTAAWGLAASLTQPIFQGGTLLYRERAARDLYDQAAAQYRSSVIGAFQNVADALHTLQADADALRAADATERATRTSFDLTRRQVDLGQTNYLALLTAQQGYLQAVINRIQAQANRFADTAALFQALGGGWWNRTDVGPQREPVLPLQSVSDQK
jgi:NodT family efflux transporter outer membrane factor (OMF) lipoprotein